jgi:hypothetical protein
MARVFALMIQGLLARAVSRYKVCAGHIFITGYKNWMRTRARSRYNELEIYPGAGAKAKTVTSLLILLSVLWVCAYFFIILYGGQFGRSYSIIIFLVLL